MDAGIAACGGGRALSSKPVLAKLHKLCFQYLCSHVFFALLH